MRTILFRGKRKDNGEWIEGDLIHIDIGCVIVYNRVLSIDDSLPKGIDLSFSNDEFAVVDPSTVCQYTGLNDKNGKMIFEGDIIRIEIPKREGGVNPPLIKICEVYYKDSSFYCTWGWRSDTNLDGFSYNVIFEIMGNIHDNPELIKSK